MAEKNAPHTMWVINVTCRLYLAALCLAILAPIPSARAADALPDAGVPLTLAQARAARVSDLAYALSLDIPAKRVAPIAGRLHATFKLTDAEVPLAFDFAAPASALHAVRANGKVLAVQIVKQHVVIPTALLRRGDNTIEFDFTAGDGPLNRGDDMLYSLFVPARASHALPLFDQPDLKARWQLTLTLPAAWQAVSNAQAVARQLEGSRARVTFAPTLPIASYLFAFAAGRFEIAQYAVGARTLRMFHREHDAARLARNGEAIARAHAQALDWMEDYTGIAYPYDKFDYVLIPAFQFSGMEHPGAIWYNAERLLLDASATQWQQLQRANVVAHETAHMWFGDLVTMRWFDDVWLKEVFANFMAAKMVNPQFPDIDHDLRFFMQHAPGAYAVDRTPGANPIGQALDNLANAGALYGNIIYLKAPLVMRQLELLLGQTALRDGLREYLNRYAHGNATWPELVALLKQRTTVDLAAWSAAWVYSRGRPRIIVTLQSHPPAVNLVQDDPRGRGLVWPQIVEVAAGYADGVDRRRITLAREAQVTLDAARGAPRWVLPAGGGLAYGDIVLATPQQAALATAVPQMLSAGDRGAAIVTLWEAMLEGRFGPADMQTLLYAALPVEADELDLARLLTCQRELFWRFSSPITRAEHAERIEALLRAGLDAAPSARTKAEWFAALSDVSSTPPTLDWLERVWRRAAAVPGLTLSESDETDLALHLTVRGRTSAMALFDDQIARVDNADRKARLRFLRPALSPDAGERAAFFASLKAGENRAHEAWVLDAVHWLHHPLRADSSLALLPAALAMLPELQRTGDIFFPKGWADATLGGYQNGDAAKLVREFIAALPSDYPPRLRWVLEASADPLQRAARLILPTQPNR